MFERMDISESVYEGAVEPSYKKYTSWDATHAGHSRKNRGKYASSHTYSAMSERSIKRRKIYVDYPASKSKNSLIHGPGNLSYECKFLGYFGCRYAKTRPTKERGHDPVPDKKFNRQQ